MLTRRCREGLTLFMCINAIMRFTFNNNNVSRELPHVFTQGQLCIIRSLPDTQLTINEQRMEVTIVPPGVRIIDVTRIPRNWATFRLRRRNGQEMMFAGNKKAFRNQWPLKSYVCSTIHKVAGDTVEGLAAQISSNEKGYTLWQKQQLLIVVSRVRSLDQLLFVGSMESVIEAMLILLKMHCPIARKAERALITLANLPARVLETSISHPLDELVQQPLPMTDVGVVYMLIGVPLYNLCYFGMTTNMRRRLTQHNTGNGAQFTREHDCA
jgi:hypothetical protein